MTRRGALLCLLAFVLSACPKPPADEKEVARDLHGYLQQLQVWEPAEKAIFDRIDAIEATRYVDENKAIELVASIRPVIEEHNRRAGKHVPATREVAELHDVFVLGWRELFEAFGGMLASLEGKDYAKLATHKQRMLASRRRIIGSIGQIDKLISRYRRELEEVARELETTATPGAAAAG